MSPCPSVAAFVLWVLFLFGYALLFAAVEIEIEGSHGWAERLPTGSGSRRPTRDRCA
jgi:hypothetical protein